MLSEVVTWLDAIGSELDLPLYLESLPDFLSHWPEIAFLNGHSVLTDKEARADEEYMLSGHVLERHILSGRDINLESQGIMADLLHPVLLHLRKQEVIPHQKRHGIVDFRPQEALHQIGECLLEESETLESRGGDHELLICLHIDMHLALTKDSSLRVGVEL